jgi:hypothetical protein
VSPEQILFTPRPPEFVGGSGDSGGYGDLFLPGSHGFGSPYHVSEGAGRYAGITGSGELILKAVAAKGKGPAHGKITITFEIPTG